MASIRKALLSLTAIASLAAGLPAMATSSTQTQHQKAQHSHRVASANTDSSSNSKAKATTTTKPSHLAKSTTPASSGSQKPATSVK